MPDNRETRRLKAEVDRLRAKLHAAHDLLHNDRLNDLHELLHCDSCEEAAEALTGQNISVGSAARLAAFIPAFNRLCATHQINAAACAMIPSAVRKGFVSIQFGGSVEVINWLRRSMGMAETKAVGDHEH